MFECFCSCPYRYQSMEVAYGFTSGWVLYTKSSLLLNYGNSVTINLSTLTIDHKKCFSCCFTKHVVWVTHVFAGVFWSSIEDGQHAKTVLVFDANVLGWTQFPSVLEPCHLGFWFSSNMALQAVNYILKLVQDTDITVQEFHSNSTLMRGAA